MAYPGFPGKEAVKQVAVVVVVVAVAVSSPKSWQNDDQKLLSSKNIARLYVKSRMSICICTESCDLLKVPYMTYYSRSRQRRFILFDFNKKLSYRRGTA